MAVSAVSVPSAPLRGIIQPGFLWVALSSGCFALRGAQGLADHVFTAAVLVRLAVEVLDHEFVVVGDCPANGVTGLAMSADLCPGRECSLWVLERPRRLATWLVPENRSGLADVAQGAFFGNTCAYPLGLPRTCRPTDVCCPLRRRRRDAYWSRVDSNTTEQRTSYSNKYGHIMTSWN